MGDFLAVRAWIGWVRAGTTAFAAVITSLVGVSVPAGTAATAVILSWCVDGGVAVVMDGRRVLGGVGGGLDALILDELSEERDLVGDA